MCYRVEDLGSLFVFILICLESFSFLSPLSSTIYVCIFNLVCFSSFLLHYFSSIKLLFFLYYGTPVTITVTLGEFLDL